MQLFGKELFNFKKPSEPIQPMYDFAQHGMVSAPEPILFYTQGEPFVKKETKQSEKARPEGKPKDLYEAHALHNQSFTIKVDPAYLQEQMELVREKLSLLGVKPKDKRKTRNEPEMVPVTEWGAASYGRQELESILERFQNRLKLPTLPAVSGVIDKYPHTTSDLINKVVNDHSNLRCENARPFIPDFPKEAVRAMREYNQMCETLCKKHSVFYVLAERKADAEINKRRDPILLAQSPFGFFWQILGAWDKEMVYLADL